MKKLSLVCVLFAFATLFMVGNAMAWTGTTANCTADAFGITAAADGAANFELLYCNFYNAVTGYIGATIGIVMLVWGVYQGAFARAGVVATVPMIILGISLAMAPQIVDWLGVTQRVIPYMFH